LLIYDLFMRVYWGGPTSSRDTSSRTHFVQGTLRP
jgi:hypothetical protein